MRKILLTISFLLCSVATASALDVTLGGDSYTLSSRGDRFISSSEMQSKAVSGNLYWTWITDRNLPAPTPSYATMGYTERMAQYALMYMVNPTLYGDEGAAARLLLLNMGSHYDTSNGSDNEDYGSIDSRDIAYTYDWIYPLLSAADKTTIIGFLTGDFDDMLDRHSYTTWNLRLTKMMGYFMLGLSLYEDSTEAQEWVQDAWTEWKSEVEPKFVQGAVNGHNFSGSAYGYNRVFSYGYAIYQTLENGLGLNSWPDTDPTVKYFMLQLAPNTNSGAGVDNVFYSEGNVGNPRLTLRTMTSYFHSLYRARGTLKARGYDFLAKVLQPSSVSGSLYFRDAFMWLDSREPLSDYTLLPSAMFADGTDIVMSKEDWTTGATWVGFTAANWLGDHQGKNAGSYKIYRNEPLLVEDGSSWNATGVVDGNIIFLDDGWVRDESYGSVRNTGNWGYINAAQADIERNEIGSNFTYARGNLTGLYIDGTYMKKVDSHYRSVLHLGDYVVAADNITTTSSAGSANGVDNGREVVKSAFLHFPGAPSLSGNQITYTGASSRIITDVLLPASSTISSTTQNYAERVSIVNTSLGQHDKFLFVHKVGGTGETLSSSLISGVGGQGALFNDTVVMFTSSTDNADITTLSYSVDAVDHYITDLPPHTEITVTRNGQTIADAQNSGGAGVFSFSASSGAASYTVQVGDAIPVITCYLDADGDGYSDGTSEVVETCSTDFSTAAQLTAISGDCDDSNPDINPGAKEIPGNGIDEDCSGSDQGSVQGPRGLKVVGG